MSAEARSRTEAGGALPEEGWGWESPEDPKPETDSDFVSAALRWLLFSSPIFPPKGIPRLRFFPSPGLGFPLRIPPLFLPPLPPAHGYPCPRSLTIYRTSWERDEFRGCNPLFK